MVGEFVQALSLTSRRSKLWTLEAELEFVSHPMIVRLLLVFSSSLEDAITSLSVCMSSHYCLHKVG